MMKNAVTGLAVALLLFGASASAEDTGTMSSMGKTMHHMGGAKMHMMPATVTSVDQKTGIVEATSEGMALKLHFPPASLADVKTGDKITLHLGFTKP